MGGGGRGSGGGGANKNKTRTFTSLNAHRSVFTTIAPHTQLSLNGRANAFVALRPPTRETAADVAATGQKNFFYRRKNGAVRDREGAAFPE